ncbi:Cys-Gln thioester bond-forming surface protein [Cellulosimicrobium sp. CUA-896]|uniref:Cys-Gln thioester bond-forming surface protein n=1 Tax=Cellulosimicrobium sp. CUA-896 TaxID=1517881 RepID=UPI00095F4D44|nr:Cys-Gln thioester bond-forming surface protein [Cellulosimicrobium sp. CUA-896]OLT53300.1 hypothetical protein BJF88_12100 [Cellulosimicrobium sp. CUA-896]
MKVRRTAAASAVSAALVLGAPLAAHASDTEATPVADPATTTATSSEPSATDLTPVEPDDPGQPDAAVEPVAEETVAEETTATPDLPADGIAAPAGAVGTASEDLAADAGAPAPADPVAVGTEPKEDATGVDAHEDDVDPLHDHDHDHPVGVSASVAMMAATSAATTLAADQAAYPHPEYEAHWHDGGADGFGCDYWYFHDPVVGGSGKDWSGWSNNPQLHFLHHTIVEADGTTNLAYDRDIAASWWHAWNGEVVHADPEGMTWDNTDAHQTVLFNGYAGGADLAARAVSARDLLARAGVTSASSATDDRTAEYTAYEATQFAVWYFSTGRDVMGLFFDVDSANRVTVSDMARQELAGSWSSGASDRTATMEVAAWLIEKALTENVVVPQPGFVPDGFVRNGDGSTDYGFTSTLLGGTGDVHVELRTADGSPMPAGIVLVDAQGRVVTSVTPGQKVFVRVPAGTDVTRLPAFQVWGSAVGTTMGSPRFYTGWDNMTSPGQQHWLIGLGALDQPSVAWGWTGVTLADLVAGPGGPVRGDTGTAVPVGAPSTDPANLGLSDAQPVAAVAAARTATALASTGGDTGALLATGALVVLAGTGLVLVSRRRAVAP